MGKAGTLLMNDHGVLFSTGHISTSAFLILIYWACCQQPVQRKKINDLLIYKYLQTHNLYTNPLKIKLYWPAIAMVREGRGMTKKN
jgi:hypothetical protein